MQRLRDIRLRRGLSQADLSTATGVAEYTISEIETGKRAPRPSTLRKLAKGLEVDVEDLYGKAKFLHVMHSGASLALQTVDNIDEVLADGEVDCTTKLEYVRQYAEVLRRTLLELEEGLVEGLAIEAKYEGKS